MNQNKLIVLAGNVGTGKSTFAKEYAKRNRNITIVCPDDLRDHYDEAKLDTEIEKRILDELEKGNSVVVDGTNYNSNIRKNWYGWLARKAEVGRVIYDFGVGDDTTLQRRVCDGRGKSMEYWRGEHEYINSNWDPITEEEGFDEIIPMNNVV